MSNIIRNDILTPVSSKRTTKEKLFKICGLSAIIFALSMLVILFTTIFSKGYSVLILRISQRGSSNAASSR